MKIQTFNEFINALYETNKTFISEGLIYTYSLTMLKRTLRSFLSATSTEALLNIYEYNNTCELVLQPKDSRLIESLIGIGRQHGYILSQIVLIPYGKTEPKVLKHVSTDRDLPDLANYSSICLLFESKYDTKVVDMPDYIYHVTNKQNLKKIDLQGLVPRSKSKLAFHPHRIYFSLTIDDAKDLIPRFSELEKKDKDDYCILKLSTEDLKVKFYEDPNYKEPTGQLKGVYTHENIKTKNLEIVDPHLYN